VRDRKNKRRSFSMRRPIGVLLVTLFTLSAVSPAYAYLDPGTGSMFLQAVIASLLAAATAVGVFWQKIKGFFSRQKKGKDDAGAGD
jgi:hypothetical protein